MGNAFNEIFNFVKELEIIDTHEHIPLSENQRGKNTDVLKEYLSDYFNHDLISSGLRKADFLKVVDTKTPIKQRWKIVEPYWNFARYTGYGRALDIAAKGLYGINNICSRTIEQLNKKFLDSLKPGHFQKVIKEKSRIKIILLDSEEVLDRAVKCDKEFFRPVYNINNWVFPDTQEKISRLEEQSNNAIKSFEDYLRSFDGIFKKALKLSAVAFKNSLAYERSLSYEKVRESEAKKSFNEFMKSRASFINIQKGGKFQDFMMHYILGLANEKNSILQFHTGMQGGNGNILSNSNPSLLSNLFLEYPNVKFDLFHIAYPYQNVLAVLAKIFPNVYIDMCWAHIISPNASVNALLEFIDTVPINKISAFGGDYCFIDGVYGHQHLARINVSKALAKKVEEGVFDVQKAKEISKMLFYKNPYRLFNLSL